MKSLKVAIRISEATSKGKRSKRRKRSFPSGWKIAHTYIVSHHEVGGVTDGRFSVEVRSVVGSVLSQFWVSHVAGVLGEALDELTTSHQLVDLPSSGQLNPLRGILS